MNRYDLSNLYAFAAVAQYGSFSRAAENLATAPSSISQTIRNLEDRLGVLLFNRNTRSVALTPAGEHLLERVRPMLSEIGHALEEIHFFADRPVGNIRIHAWRLGWEDHIEPILPQFRKAFPDVVLDICIDDSIIDLVAGHYDVGIRLGARIDQDMIAVRLGPDIRQIGVAAPCYIERHGRPQSPQDLVAHNCLRWRWAGETNPQQWRFRDGDKTFDVDTRGSLIVSDQHAAVRAAIAGIGIAFRAEHAVQPYIEQGLLVPLLEDWAWEYPGFHLCYPKQRKMMPALRGFIDLLKEEGRATRRQGPAAVTPAFNGREITMRLAD